MTINNTYCEPFHYIKRFSSRLFAIATLFPQIIVFKKDIRSNTSKSFENNRIIRLSKANKVTELVLCSFTNFYLVLLCTYESSAVLTLRLNK